MHPSSLIKRQEDEKGCEPTSRNRKAVSNDRNRLHFQHVDAAAATTAGNESASGVGHVVMGDRKTRMATEERILLRSVIAMMTLKGCRQFL